MRRTWASNQGRECREYYPRQHDGTVSAVRELAFVQPTGFSRVAPVRQRAYPGSYRLFEEFIHIEHSLSFEDVIGSPGDFMCHDGQGFCLAMLFLESGTIYLCSFVLSQEEDRGFREGPLEVNVADLSTGVPLFLPGRFLGRFDESAVGGKVLDFRETFDVVDFVKDRQSEDASYSGKGAYSEVGIAVMLFGYGRYFFFELRKDSVIEIKEVQVELDILLDAFPGEELSDSIPLRFSAYVVFKSRQVVLIGGVLDVSHEFGSFSGEMHSSTEQITGGAHFSRVDVCDREHSASGKDCDLMGIYSVVLSFPAVNSFHVEGMTEDERDPFLLTQIGQPVPGESTFNGDQEIVLILFDHFQKQFPVSTDISVQEDFSSPVNDAEIHGFCMQVDSAIIFVLLGVESHSVPPCCVVVTFIIPSGMSKEALMSIKAL